MKLLWLATAERDLIEAVEYVARDSSRAALALQRRIRTQVGQLPQWPYMGRPGAMEGTRELVISRTPYKAVYVLAEGRVEVTRIVHGARLWPPADR